MSQCAAIAFGTTSAMAAKLAAIGFVPRCRAANVAANSSPYSARNDEGYRCSSAR